MSAQTADLNTVQESVLDAIKQSQSMTLDAVRSVTEFVAPVTSRLPKAPFADQLPDPGAAVDAGFAFWTEVISAQRDFARELTQLLTPAPATS